MVRPIRIERMTLGLGVPCSILLSYGRIPECTELSGRLQALGAVSAKGYSRRVGAAVLT